jgi:hypothetical protein
MFGIEFGLGRFGDLRLQKGGPICMRHWWSDQGRAFAGLLGRGRARFSSQGFCAIRL